MVRTRCEQTERQGDSFIHPKLFCGGYNNGHEHEETPKSNSVSKSNGTRQNYRNANQNYFKSQNTQIYDSIYENNVKYKRTDALSLWHQQ